MDLIQVWYCDRYYSALRFYSSLTDLYLDSRSQECEKARNSVPVITQSFQSVVMEFGVLLRLCGVTNFMLIVSHSLNIQGRDAYLYDFININFNIGLYSDIYRPVSFKLGMMIESTKL